MTLTGDVSLINGSGSGNGSGSAVTGLRVVDFPSVLQAESKIFGVYTMQEILVAFLAAAATWICLKPFGTVSVAAAIATFAVIVILKAMVPDEVGYAFPLYEARFALKKKVEYAYEKGTTQNIPALKFVDNWVLKLAGGCAAVAEVSPVNLFYSSPADQGAFIDGYASFLKSLDFPVQIISISHEFDIAGYLNRFVLRLKDDDVVGNDVLDDMARGYLRLLDEVSKRTHRRRYFIAVSVPKGKDENTALGELRRRVETVAAALGRVGLQTKILSRDDVLQLYELINTKKVLPKNYASSAFLVSQLTYEPAGAGAGSGAGSGAGLESGAGGVSAGGVSP